MADAVKVTNNGLGIITNRIIGAGTEPKYAGWGIGTTEAAEADTGLETASAEARTTGTSSRQQTNDANDTYRVVAEIVCTGSDKAITEVALFDAAAAGNCFIHGTFTAINIGVQESIEFTINIVFNQV